MMNFDGNKGPSTINSRNDSQSDSRNHCIYNRLQWEDLYIKIKTREVFNRIQLNANRRIINSQSIYTVFSLYDCRLYIYVQSISFQLENAKKKEINKNQKENTNTKKIQNQIQHQISQWSVLILRVHWKRGIQVHYHHLLLHYHYHSN